MTPMPPGDYGLTPPPPPDRPAPLGPPLPMPPQQTWPGYPPMPFAPPAGFPAAPINSPFLPPAMGPYPAPYPGAPWPPPDDSQQQKNAPPTGSGRGSIIATLIAWLVILLVTAAIFFRGAWLPDRWRSALGADPAAPTQPPGAPATHPSTTQPALPSSARALKPIEKVRSTQVQLLGRYAVGIKLLTGAGTQVGGIGNSGQLAQLAEQVEHAAGPDDPIGEFRTIPIIAELLGREAALKRLNEFEADHTIVRLRRDVDLLHTLYTRGSDALFDADRRYLAQRHGWAGELAGAWDLADTDPYRQSALAPARQMMVIVLISTLIVGLALLAGLILSIGVLVKLAGGRFRRRYARPDRTSSSGVFAEAFAIYLGGFLAASVAFALWWPSAGVGASYALALLVPLGVGWMRLRGVAGAEVRYAMGWHAGRGVLREAGAGLVGYIAGLPLIGIGLITSMLLMRFFGQPGQGGHPIQDMPIDSPMDIIQLYLLAAVMAPLVEESMFRGALFHHLRRRCPWILSTLIVSVIFAAIHPQGWLAIPVLACVAIVLAGIREWRGSLIGSITAHAIHNGAAVSLLVLMST